MPMFNSEKCRLAILFSCLILCLGLSGCSGDDGDNGSPGVAGADGAAGTDGNDGADGADGSDGADGISCWDLNENGIKDPEEDLNGDGVVDVFDCSSAVDQAIIIGDGADLSAAEIKALGQLVANIDKVSVSSPPVVDFTVNDSHGRPAVGIAEGVVWFTFAKLMPADPDINGGVPYWQSYVNRTETADPEANTPNILDQSVQATTDSQGTLDETGPGTYRYTFATDVTSVTSPIAVPWQPALTHRVGLEIRLDGDGEVPLAPDNPVYDFAPDGGNGTGITRDIADTNSCNDCHLSFTLHGGPRKTVEYCVTCHNPGTIDQDTGESVDMAYLAHSIHAGENRDKPYIIHGFRDFVHDYSEVTHPQDINYCETCHEQSASHPDGDSWNEQASVTTCGGCHVNGMLAENPDPVTGVPEYRFDHTAAEADGFGGVSNDGACFNCHLGGIDGAGPALAVHSRIRGSDRARSEAGDNFIFDILEASNTGAGETPVVTFKVSDANGNPYDILTDAQFTNSNASLNLYLQWSTDAYYGGDENGLVLGARINDDGSVQAIQDLNFRDTGYPYRMRIGAIQEAAVKNPDGSFTVEFFRALPEEISGDVAFALGGHPAWEYTDADGVTEFERAAAVSAVYYPGEPRQAAFDSGQCNACHERLLAHGSNRNGNVEVCLLCHNSDAAVCDTNPLPDGSCPPGEGQAGYGMGLMIHAIHASSETYLGGAFEHVTYPQSVANCTSCHTPGSYEVARESARAVSTDQGADIRVWTDDIATTPTAAACGVCHSSTAARGHYESQAGQVDTLKADIVGAESGLPNGQEACAVCHSSGSEFDTARYHNPGAGD